MKRTRLGVVCGVLMVAALLLGACSAATRSLGRDAEAPMVAPYEGVGGAMPQASDAAARSEGAASANKATTDASAAPAGQAQQQPWDRMIIKNGTMTLVADDVAGTVDAMSGIVASVPGAHVFGSNVRYEGSRQIATITLRVPSQSFDEVMARLRRLATKPQDVMNEQVSSQDVTEEFVDLQSQVRNLQAQEQRYLTLLDRAQSVADILAIQQRLGETRMQIERIQGRLTYLERRAEFGTIVVTVNARPVGVRPQAGVWDPQATFARALASVAVLLQNVGDVAIWLAVFSVVLVPMGLIVWLVVWLVRRASRPEAPAAPVRP
jgi:hypothetical protein